MKKYTDDQMADFLDNAGKYEITYNPISDCFVRCLAYGHVGQGSNFREAVSMCMELAAVKTVAEEILK